MQASAFRIPARLARRVAEYNKADIVATARRIRAEWEDFLARSDFEFAQDALSKELVSLEDAGLAENTEGPRHGFGSVHAEIDFLFDGEDARYEMN